MGRAFVEDTRIKGSARVLVEGDVTQIEPCEPPQYIMSFYCLKLNTGHHIHLDWEVIGEIVKLHKEIEDAYSEEEH